MKATLCGGLAAVLFAAACSSDEGTGTPADGGPDASGTGGAGTGGKGTGGKGGTGGGGAPNTGGGGTAGTGGVTDGGGDANDGGNQPLSLCGGKTGADQIACGEYIVRHIDACGDCHSPADPVTHAPNTTNLFLAGNPAPIFDLDPTDNAKGLVYPPNLTVLASQNWTAADLKDAFLNGKRSQAHGGNLAPIMPYSNFHNMAAADADAIAAYLLSLKAVTTGPSIPPDQDLPTGLDRATSFPTPYVDATKIPNTNRPKTDAHYQDAVLGRYLAGELGICIECHTERTKQGALDSTKFFAGGETFNLGPPLPTVTSLNITPAKNGIQGWTFDIVEQVILKGIDDQKMPLCPPMPFGPFGAFGGMQKAHADAIGYYLTSIPGVENPGDGGAFQMIACYPPEAGMDASMPDGSTPADASTDGG